MEAKVDVRKLQLLNDRIAQTIEALNQVRLSVHGLSHTPGLPSTMPFSPGMPFSPAMPFSPGMPFTPPNIPYPGFGMTPPPIYPYQGTFPGLQHTPFTTPYTLPTFPGFTPPNVPGFTPPGFQGSPVLPFMSGLSHTSPEFIEQRLIELKASDPYRLAQTFPFMNTPTWPTIW